MAARNAPTARTTGTSAKARKSATKKVASKKVAAKKYALKKAAPKKIVAKKVVAKKAAPKKAASTKVAAKKAAARKSSTKSTARKAAVRKPGPITPEQALANTRTLLEAKNEQARQPPAYPSGGDPHSHGHAPETGHPVDHQDLQKAPGIEPAATEGHPVGRGNQGMRNQS